MDSQSLARRLTTTLCYCFVATLVVGIVFGLVTVRVASAATITVTNTNDSGAGSLRQAITNAAAGDTIVFDSSLTGRTITLTSGQLTINKRLYITGLGASNLTISGNNTSRIFNVGTSGVVAIAGLTIANGRINNLRGGGVNNAGALTLDNCIVTRNQIGGNLLGILMFGGGGIYNSGTVTITNSTISDNKDAANSAGGGGISNDGKLILSNSIVRGNQVHTASTLGQYGGGGISNRGTATITASTISNNTATGYSNGGGGGIYNNGQMTIATSVLQSNNSNSDAKGAWGGFGGGILNWQAGNLLIQNSTLVGNVADRDGGGIENLGTLTVRQSTIRANVARGKRPSSGSGQVGTGGGGIDNTTGTLTVENSTISGNTSNLHGGGLINDEGTLRATFTTISNNAASILGGGIYITGTVTDTLSDLTNTIIANSVGQDCINQSSPITMASTLIEDNTCSPTLSGDPNLGPLQNNGGTTETHALLSGSLAIDRILQGVNGCGTTFTLDQRGVSRPSGSGCDLGAYELDVTQIAPTSKPQIKTR
ncbi:MAG: hypothetical protein HY868_08145 [Chloroflexi bacterium]|nr:hypothetical protein [Chloroflexota bacterium]